MSKVLIPGVGARTPDKAMKAITSIPGWADQYAEGSEGSVAEVAEAVKESPYGFVCVQIRSTMMARIPWDIVDPKGEPVSDEHPARLLLLEFNPESNWSDGIRDTEADQVIYGNSFWLKVGKDDENDNTDFLMRLNPATMTVKASRSGIDAFEQEIDGVSAPFERWQIVYFRSYDPTNDFGALSPAKVCLRDMQAEAYVSRHLRAFFKNYAMPAVMLSTEQTVPEQEGNRIVRWFRRSFGSVDDRYKVTIADKGLKPTMLSYPLNDLALGPVRAELRQSICAAFRVPATLAGAWEAANYATAKEQRRSLYSETLFPEAEYMAGVINAELLSEFEDDIEFVWKFDELDIMRQDVDEERKSIIELHDSGIMNTQAAGERLDLEANELGDGIRRGEFEAIGESKAEFESVDISADMRKWRRKALKRIKEGKSPVVDYKSDLIPDTLRVAVKAQLSAAVTYSDVSAIFADVVRHGSY